MDYLHTLVIDLGASLLSVITISYIISAAGLNLHFGYTGLMNIGQAGFMLIGAYGFAITVQQTHQLLLGIVVSILSAVAFALVLGIPTLRLRGDYLAIVTIAAAEIVRLVGDDQSLQKWTGGSRGIPGSAYTSQFVHLSPFPKSGTYAIGPYHYSWSAGDSWWLRLVALVLLVLIVLITFLLVRSPWGRVLRGIREDENAVRSLGKNVTLYKTQALIIGGVMGALGGVVNVLATAVTADGMGRTMTFELYTCLLLGGAATVFGPVLGTFLYWLVINFLQDTITAAFPALHQEQVPELTWIVIGVGLMLIVIFRPQGILGNKKELTFGA